MYLEKTARLAKTKKGKKVDAMQNKSHADQLNSYLCTYINILKKYLLSNGSNDYKAVKQQ